MDWALVGGIAGVLAAVLAGFSVGQNWRAARRSTERNDVRWSVYADGREIVVANDGQDVARDVHIEVGYLDDDNMPHSAEIDCDRVTEEAVGTGVVLPPVVPRNEYTYLRPNLGPDHYVHWTVTWRSKLGAWTTESGREEIYDP